MNQPPIEQHGTIDLDTGCVIAPPFIDDETGLLVEWIPWSEL